MKYLKNMWKTIKKKINFIWHNYFSISYGIYLFFIFFGIVFFCFQIYSRIILERSPKDLSIFSISLFVVSIIIIITQLFVLKKYINKLLMQQQQQETNTLSFLLSKFMVKFYATYKQFFKYLNNLVFVEKHYNVVGQKILHYFFFHAKKFYFIFFILPRVIPVLVFFIEVVVFHKIIYFYKILWLFLIPILARIIRFMFICFSEERLNVIQLFIKVKSTEELCENQPFGHESILSYEWVISPYLDHLHNITLNEILLQYIVNRKIYRFWNYFYKLEEKKHIVVINLIITILLIISWCYIFFIHVKMLETDIFLTLLQILSLCVSLIVLLTLYIIDTKTLRKQFLSRKKKYKIKPILFATHTTEHITFSFLFERFAYYISSKISWHTLFVKFLEIKEIYLQYFLWLFSLLTLQTIVLFLFFIFKSKYIFIYLLFLYFVEFVFELALNFYYQLAHFILNVNYDPSKQNLDKVYDNVFFDGLIYDKTTILERPHLHVLSSLIIDFYHTVKTSVGIKLYLIISLLNHIIFIKIIFLMY